jgi:hypothetical protein
LFVLFVFLSFCLSVFCWFFWWKLIYRIGSLPSTNLSFYLSLSQTCLLSAHLVSVFLCLCFFSISLYLSFSLFDSLCLSVY